MLGVSNNEEWPELERQWAGRELEMPEETMATRKVRQMNLLERFMQPQAVGITWPWGTIALNRELINPDELGDTLVHELTHIGQRRKSGLVKHLKEIMMASPEYLARPYEQEALAAEQQRKIRRGDVYLSR